jgi:hypothetical protein
MFTGSLNTLVHDLVIVIAYIGSLLSGYAGMTIWARKGGRPAGGFFLGGSAGSHRRVHPRAGQAQTVGNGQRHTSPGAGPVSPLRRTHQGRGAGLPVLPP